MEVLFGTPADNSNNPAQSIVRFFENGMEMGAATLLTPTSVTSESDASATGVRRTAQGRRFGFPPPTTPIRGRTEGVTLIVCLCNDAGNG